MSNNARAVVTRKSAEAVRLQIDVPESLLPEEPHPWFQMIDAGRTWKGQACNPPCMTDDGLVRFTLDLYREDT